MENYSYLLGFMTPKMFLVMCLFSALGIAVSLLFDSQKRDQVSKNTPNKFNTWFLIRDNWKTILVTFLVVLITIRFATSLFPNQFGATDVGSPEGMEKWFFGSVLIGLGYNQLIQVWKQRAKFLQAPRKEG